MQVEAGAHDEGVAAAVEDDCLPLKTWKNLPNTLSLTDESFSAIEDNISCAKNTANWHLKLVSIRERLGVQSTSSTATADNVVAMLTIMSNGISKCSSTATITYKSYVIGLKNKHETIAAKQKLLVAQEQNYTNAITNSSANADQLFKTFGLANTLAKKIEDLANKDVDVLSKDTLINYLDEAITTLHQVAYYYPRLNALTDQLEYCLYEDAHASAQYLITQQIPELNEKLSRFDVPLDEWKGVADKHTYLTNYFSAIQSDISEQSETVKWQYNHLKKRLTQLQSLYTNGSQYSIQSRSNSGG